MWMYAPPPPKKKPVCCLHRSLTDSLINSQPGVRYVFFLLFQPIRTNLPRHNLREWKVIKVSMWKSFKSICQQQHPHDENKQIPHCLAVHVTATRHRVWETNTNSTYRWWRMCHKSLLTPNLICTHLTTVHLRMRHPVQHVATRWHCADSDILLSEHTDLIPYLSNYTLDL